MKNTSKLSQFAVVVLLVLIMPVSTWAAEHGQEIGVPQAMGAPVKGCFGAVLLPDDEHFYTVREGFLTQYKINPFKKIGSIAIDREPAKERQGGARCRVLMTDDKAKLIIVYPDRIFSLDARTGQVLNISDRKNGQLATATISGNDLVILDRYEGEYGKQFLTIWDANTLQLKREIQDLESFGFIQYPHEATRMVKIRDRIYLDTYNKTVVLNNKTYAPELTLSYKPNELNAKKLSKNFQKIYVLNILELKATDHLSGKQTTYDDVKGGSIFVFDQIKRESSIENLNSISRGDYSQFPLARYEQISHTIGYVMVGPSNAGEARVALANLNTGMWFRFYQYESGEAIMVGGDDKYFRLTPGARRFLMMKNSAGKIVPINDPTFAKYHRTEDRP